MTFGESVKTCFAKYATFEGRASRSEYWWWVLFTIIASAMLGVISSMLAAVFSLATLLPYLAVGVRRLHDTDRSGWWLLIGFIPLIGAIVLIVWCCQTGRDPNRFGAEGA